jgi:hypothetical protein
MPSDRFPALHGTVVTLAGPAGISAGVLAVVGCTRSRFCPRVLAYCGLAMLLFALLTLTQYMRQFWLGANASPLLPLLQKTATLLLLAWMMAVAFLVYRKSSGRAG